MLVKKKDINYLFQMTSNLPIKSRQMEFMCRHLTRLKNFHMETDNSKSDFEILEKQKNQLEIEKKEISEKYTNLIAEHNRIKNELNLYKEKLQTEKSKETEFSNKIDELNQETDTLLEEIDKWQM